MNKIMRSKDDLLWTQNKCFYANRRRTKASTIARPRLAVTAHLSPWSVPIASTKVLGVSGYLKLGLSLLSPSDAWVMAGRMRRHRPTHIERATVISYF